MSKHANQRRVRLLTTASAAVAAVAMTTAGYSAETTITPDTSTALNPLDTSTVVPSASTADTIAAVLENTGDITAEVSGTDGGLDSDLGDGDALTVTVNANDVLAVAIGNNFSNSIDLAVISNLDGDGAASLGFAINSPDGDDLTGALAAADQTADISAIASLNTISVDFADIDLDNGTVTASENTIEAAATGNAGATSLAGDLPSTYVSGTTGSSTTTYNDGTSDWLDATGSLVASTLQINVLGDDDIDDAGPFDDTPDVSAFVQDNTISIELVGSDLTVDTPDDIVTEVAAVLEDNEIAATAKGNSATSIIDVDDAATFAGSAVVTNAQINLANPGLPGAASEIRALNLDSAIFADIDSDYAPDDTNTLDGTVELTGNTISSSASGNESLGSGGAAGNQIVLDDAMSFDGPGTVDPGSELTYGINANTDYVTGDLVIHNSQGNVGYDDDNHLLIDAGTGSASITAYVQSVTTEGSSVTLTDNTVSSTARGNAASSAFATGEASASFEGSVALASQQSNYLVDVEALTLGTTVSAFVADDYEAYLAAASVVLDSNVISAAASGSQSSQSIVLDAADVDLDDDSETLDLHGGAEDIGILGNVTADGAVTIANLQGLYESDVGAWSDSAYVFIETFADNIATSTLEITENTTQASALGNSASSSFALSGTTVEGGIGAASVQVVDSSDVSAWNYYAYDEIYAWDADVEGSTLTISGNDQAAFAYGNQVSQTGSVDGTTLDFETTGVELLGADFGVGLDGNVGITNYQSIYDSDVYADLYYSWIMIGADDISGSTLEIVSSDTSANVQQAVAVGSSGSNALSLSGVSVGTGAGVASSQTISGESSVYAENEYSGIYIEVSDVGFDGDQGSTLEVSGNVQRSIAYGNTVANSLAIDGETFLINEAINEDASVVPQDPTVQAAYGVLNVQSVFDTDIVADLYGYGVSIYTDEVEGSSLINEGNAYVAAAYGNDATNSASLEHGNVTTAMDTDEEADFSSVLNLTNEQVVEDVDVFAGAAAADEGGVVYRTDIFGEVFNSSVSTSENTVQALAYGNLADNDVSVSVNNVDTEGDGFLGFFSGDAEVEDDEASVDASFSLNNVQYADGSFTATLLDDGDPAVSAEIYTIVSDITDSTVVANGNALIASATANRANNLLAVEGNSLATSTALTNYQVDPSDVSSYIGVAGTDGTPGTDDTPFTFDYELHLVWSCDEGCTLTSATDRVLLTDLTSDEIDYLEDNGWSQNGSYLTREAVESVSSSSGDSSYYDSLQDTAYSDGGTIAGTPATYGTPNQGGVTIAIGGTVDPSTVEVNDNSVSGSVTGNSATNAISVDATDLADGTDHILTLATAEGLDTLAAGDHSLVNVQFVGEGSDLDSEVYSTFAIDMEDDSEVQESTLSVDGNEQASRAVANTADNSVTLTAGNTEAGAALASNQESAGSVSALSDVDIFAPVASTGSTVSMSDNENLAVAVINNVTNTVTVDATNAGYVTYADNAYLDVDDTDAVALGDHVLLNQQTAYTSVDATATTNIYNDDYLDTASEGLGGGTVLVTGNTTTAEASANRALNSMDVSASSTLTASAGLLNSQTSSATVNASASTYAGATIVTDDITTVDGSTVTIGANTTSSLARGNAATNVLNYSAGASYGDGTVFSPSAFIESSTSGVDTVAVAQAAVLNVQTNTGAVTAESTNVSYVIALNSGGSGAAVLQDSTIGVIGNSVTATAYGNTATNVLTVASLSASAPTGVITSYQTNTAAVTASVTTVSYGANSLGALSGSAASVTSNAITATAVGNNVVNAITSGS